MSFLTYLEKNSPRISELIANYFRVDTNEDIKRYLYAPLAKYSSNGGKRHRPLICELAAGAVGGDPTKVSAAAAAIEHFHTAALIHDDIADESTLRRGEPCLHITEGLGLAINAGDLALSQVTGSVLDDKSLSESLRIRILEELVEMTTRTIEGQALDIGWARDGRFDLTIDDYLQMAKRKTAYYSGSTPLAVGAIIGGGTEEQIAVLRDFGMATGLAFQIQDDLLNLTGNKELLGKDYRSDITEGKRTLIAVHALMHSEQNTELTAILASHTTASTMLACAVDIMEAAGSLEFACDYATGLVAVAKAEMADKLEDNEYTKLLLQMADFFIERMR
ncbi:MAG: polyprenyl synthetase family protein [Coriobacteriia bacterium]|nr:polyprenyl synthetase family protein [Coriobacteriia bacterium]MCL2749592.1 polyprenyl synthetase family protein [Coriobacteriia bacterium]